MKKKILILTTSTIALFLVFMVFNVYAHDGHSEGDNEDNTMMGENQSQNQGDNESEQPEQEEEKEQPEQVEEKEKPEQVEETEQPEVSDEMDSDKIKEDHENKNKKGQKMGEDKKNENANEHSNKENREDRENEHDKKSIERKNNVANAVAEILKVANRNKDLKKENGIGEEIKVIAIDQVLNQDMIEKSLKEVDARSGFVIFFIGPKYNKINEASKLVEKNNEHIKKLVEIKSQIKNKDDVQKIEEQVSVLENSTKQVEDYIKKSESAFSLFGWLSRIFSK